MAGFVSKSFIGDLLGRVDIVDVISQRLPLKKKGTNHLACCPFHNEKSPSFSVNHAKQFYHCFGCGVSGDAIAFLMEFDRLSFVEAIVQLAKTVGLEVVYEDGIKPKEIQNQADIFHLMSKISAFYQQQLERSSHSKAYLTKRGLSAEIISQFQLGYAPDAWRQIEMACGNQPQNRSLLISAGMLIANDNHQPHDRFRNRLMFPIHNRRGNITGFGGRTLGDDNPKYLNSPETDLFHKGQELYGLYQAQAAIREAGEIVVVEGYMDVIALAQHGIPHAVATLGTAATTEHIKILLRHAAHITFCFDGDNAGRRAAWRALDNALAFVHEGVNLDFCFLPETEDPDSYLHKFGKEAFLQLTKKALTLSEFFIQQLTADLDLGTIEGKNKLSQTAKPLLQKLTPGVYQQLLIKQLASILRMDERAFAQAVGIFLPHGQSPVKIRPHTNPRQPATSPVRSMMTLLLQHPELALQVEEPQKLAALPVPGIDLLVHMLDLIQSNPHINTAMILHHFADHPQAETLKKLATRELFYVENGLIQEFADSLRRIQKTYGEQQMEALLQKANVSGLLPDERETLQKLIREYHDTTN